MQREIGNLSKLYWLMKEFSVRYQCLRCRELTDNSGTYSLD